MNDPAITEPRCNGVQTEFGPLVDKIEPSTPCVQPEPMNAVLLDSQFQTAAHHKQEKASPCTLVTVILQYFSMTWLVH